MIEITNNDETYVYDYDSLFCEQIESATALFMLHQQQQQQPPASVKELKIAGGTTILCQAFAYTIRKRNADGSLEPYDVTKVETYERFVRTLPGPQWSRLQECRADFFSRAEILDVGSIVPYLPTIQSLVALMQEAQEKRMMRSELNVPASNRSETSSISPALLESDSEPHVTPA